MRVYSGLHSFTRLPAKPVHSLVYTISILFTHEVIQKNVFYSGN